MCCALRQNSGRSYNRTRKTSTPHFVNTHNGALRKPRFAFKIECGCKSQCSPSRRKNARKTS